MRRLSVCGLFWLAFTMAATAQTVSYAVVASSYTQNFNSLNSARGNSNLAWTNGSTLPNWYLFRQPSPGTAIPTYQSSIGDNSTGSFYSFGLNGSSESALGAVSDGSAYFGNPGNGSVAGWIAVGITNNTGLTLDRFILAYTGEQWRRGAGASAAQDLIFQYGLGATFTTVGSWTAPGAAFNFISPNVGGPGTALDGNLPANRVTNLGGSVDLNWQPGATLWLRWQDLNDQGNADHGLAVDDFSFSAVVVPEPLIVGLLGLGGLASLSAWKYRRRSQLVSQAEDELELDRFE